MKWYDLMTRVQSTGDQRRMAMFVAAMWSALADGPEWVLGNALMNAYFPFNLAMSLDGAMVPTTGQARMVAGC